MLEWYREIEDSVPNLLLHCVPLVTSLLEVFVLVDLSSGMLKAVTINCVK